MKKNIYDKSNVSPSVNKFRPLIILIGITLFYVFLSVFASHEGHKIISDFFGCSIGNNTKELEINKITENIDSYICAAVFFMPFSIEKLMDLVSHALEFSILVIFFGYLYMEHIIKTMENGFLKIDSTISSNSKPVNIPRQSRGLYVVNRSKR